MFDYIEIADRFKMVSNYSNLCDVVNSFTGQTIPHPATVVQSNKHTFTYIYDIYPK